MELEHLRTEHPAWSGPQSQAAWSTDARDRGLARFQELGLPSRKTEEWRYTSTRALGRERWALGAPTLSDAVRAAAAAAAIPTAAVELVLVNGWVAPELSRLPEVAGLSVIRLDDALAAGADPATAEIVHAHLGQYANLDGPVAFTALNAAFAQDGAVILLDRDADVGIVSVIHIADGATPTVAHSRHLVVAGRGSRGELVEQHIACCGARSFSNAVVEVSVGDGAALEHHRWVCEGERCSHVGRVEAHLGRDARYALRVACLGGELVRHDLNVRFNQPGGHGTLTGIYLPCGQEHVDNHTVLDHRQPHCTSRELFKGVIGGHGTAVFNGSVIVREQAQLSDSEQSNRNLLLTDDASVHSKPELEIYADDVKCAHGTAIGALDEEQIWYLRSRGIDRRHAAQILTRAFAEELPAGVADDALRERLTALVHARLDALIEEAT